MPRLIIGGEIPPSLVICFSTQMVMTFFICPLVPSSCGEKTYPYDPICSMVLKYLPNLGWSIWTCWKKIFKHHGAYRIQGGAPPVISWFIIPINYRYNPLINPSEIGLMFTNLANELGHHLVGNPPKSLHMFQAFQAFELSLHNGSGGTALQQWQVGGAFGLERGKKSQLGCGVHRNEKCWTTMAQSITIYNQSLWKALYIYIYILVEFNEFGCQTTPLW